MDIFFVLLSGLIPNTELRLDRDAFLLTLATILRLFVLCVARCVSASSLPSGVSVLSETGCRSLLLRLPWEVVRLLWEGGTQKPPCLGILRPTVCLPREIGSGERVPVLAGPSDSASLSLAASLSVSWYDGYASSVKKEVTA